MPFASTSIDGTTLAVGAPETALTGADAGAAYVFEKVGANWVQEQRLFPVDAGATKAFGHSVSVSGNTLLVGAPFDGSQINFGGAAYSFAHVVNDWGQTTKFTASDGGQRDQLGVSVAAKGGIGIVGALWNDAQGTDSGSAYAIDMPLAAAVPALGHYAPALIVLMGFAGLARLRRSKSSSRSAS